MQPQPVKLGPPPPQVQRQPSSGPEQGSPQRDSMGGGQEHWSPVHGGASGVVEPSGVVVLPSPPTCTESPPGASGPSESSPQATRPQRASAMHQARTARMKLQ